MTTAQNFFKNIIHLNSVSFETLDKIIGDLNKNVGLSAHFFENASQVIGSTATENYDLPYAWIEFENQINSDNTDALQQSLQNTISDIGLTQAYSTFNVCTHISTSILEYNASISSTFLSGQIYSFNGIGNSATISVPINSFSLSGNQFNSHLYDVPIDFAVYGIDNFNGSYTSSNLINFDYAWQNNTNLLIHLNYKTAKTTQYLTFYWGTSYPAFISTGYSIGTSIYVGTNNFISNIGFLSTSAIASSLSNYSGRKNFWSNLVPYNLKFNSQAYSQMFPVLWAYNRSNQTLIDGVYASDLAPPFYNVVNSPTLTGFFTSSGLYSYIYFNFLTSGLQGEINNSAEVIVNNIFASQQEQNYDFAELQKQFSEYIPLGVAELQFNPKLLNLGTNGYGVVNYTQDLPSAFVATIQDPAIWQYFAAQLVSAKNYYLSLSDIVSTNLLPLDNFVADFLFGSTVNNVSSYFEAPELSISIGSLKDFTQPYGTVNTDPLNFTEYEEKAIYDSTNIISSKEFATFQQGVLTLLDDYNLPANNTFEIYKPISYVCNGIDPFNQGVGLNYDYTLNLTFQYEDQSYLQKTLYLMASKFLLTPNQYQTRINNNQTVIGYYDVADPNSSNTNADSVSSIGEFALYGYAGLIPDLKDGVIRPILTRSFSTTGGNNTNSNTVQSNEFVSLVGISVCTTNYALEKTPYWNANMPVKPNSARNNINNVLDYGNSYGFTQLSSQIINGYAVSSLSGLGTFILTNIPVGSNCKVTGFSVNSLGAGMSSGNYTAWLYPPALSTAFPCPSPAQISYNISSGQLFASSLSLSSPGGNNYYYDFDFQLVGGGFNTTIGTSYPSIHVEVNNLAKFTASVNNYTLTSFVQTVAPTQGYLQGFTLNDGCFYGLGYTASAKINITVGAAPTVDSFFIAENNLSPGDLEYYGDFTAPQGSLISLNYSGGNQYFTLYDDEIFNSFLSTGDLNGENIDYVTIICKLIEYDNLEPSGFITINLYSNLFGIKTLVASSNQITSENFSPYSYQSVTIPIHYILNGSDSQASEYYLSIKNNLVNSSLSIQGTYTGISTSNYYIPNSSVYNDPNNVYIPGSISTSGYDLDLGVINTPIGISSVFGSNNISIATSVANVYLRKDPTYNVTSNQITLSVNATYNSSTNTIVSNPIYTSSLTTSFTGVAFTFGNNFPAGTIINSSNLIFSQNLAPNQVYIARSMSQYSQVGLATTNQLSLNSIDVNFNFTFNKLFGQISNMIYGAFNYDPNFLPVQDAAANQLQIPGPNNLRVVNPTNVVDGYWSFSAQTINSAVSIYPRSWFNYNNFLGIGTTAYIYMGYSHDIYVNIGYNSNKTFYEELIVLNAEPKWNATWMSRNSYDYKNFSVSNVIQQTYLDNIYYHIGLGSTNFGVNTGPKSAIFSGTFNPSFGNLNSEVPVTINIGTSSGVQLYINGSSQPLIDTFSVISAGSTSVVGYLTTSQRNSPVNFNILYFTLATANIEVYWTQQGISSLISSTSSSQVLNQPQQINNGYPVDNISFLNVSQTYAEATSVNYGFPPGDSFVIRSS
jgi:hypothetical protein